jgi:2-dehydro-3-deoxyphosphogalactonate aldolase
MWDICGKAVNLPVYQMLGGKFREKLKSYSYISYAKPNQKIDKNSGNRALWYGALWGNADLLCERAIEMVEEGFLALKFDPLEYVQLQSEKHLGIKLYKPYHLSAEDYKVTKITMDALRDSVGDKCDIIIGTHGQMTTASAISYSKFLENYLPLWIEEPIPPENTKEMAKVRMSTSIPIAAGEHLSTIYEFLRVLEDGAASIIQPDIGNCGGITQAKKIAAIAESYYVDVAPHVWGGPVLTAATFQLSMCIPNFIIQESILRSKDFYSEITTDFIDWKNGYLYPSKKSGLGIELNEKYIKTCLLQ